MEVDIESLDKQIVLNKQKETKDEITSSQANTVKSTNLSITSSATKHNLGSRVKTVVARDKATGKKVLYCYYSYS